MSHAFAEMVDDDAAKAALRTSQNSVLGKGKRARGVTVTRSSQEELMRAVSPRNVSASQRYETVIIAKAPYHVAIRLPEGSKSRPLRYALSRNALSSYILTRYVCALTVYTEKIPSDLSPSFVRCILV